MTKREIEKRVKELELREEFYFDTLVRIANVQKEEMFHELYFSQSDDYSSSMIGLTVAKELALAAIKKINF